MTADPSSTPWYVRAFRALTSNQPLVATSVFKVNLILGSLTAISALLSWVFEAPVPDLFSLATALLGVSLLLSAWAIRRDENLGAPIHRVSGLALLTVASGYVGFIVQLLDPASRVPMHVSHAPGILAFAVSYGSRLVAGPASSLQATIGAVGMGIGALLDFCVLGTMALAFFGRA